MSRDLCIMACIFCRDPQFQKWAGQQARAQRWVFTGCVMTVDDERLAKAFILAASEVKSRNDLDTNYHAAQRFHDRVRKPFLDWKEHQSTAPAGR